MVSQLHHWKHRGKSLANLQSEFEGEDDVTVDGILIWTDDLETGEIIQKDSE